MDTGRNIQSMSDIPTPDLYTGEAPIQSAYKVWKKVQSDLSYALGANVHRSWTGRLRVSDACPNTVTLIAPSRFVATKIETTYNDTLIRLWKKHDVVAPPRGVIISGPPAQHKPVSKNQTGLHASATQTSPHRARQKDSAYQNRKSDTDLSQQQTKHGAEHGAKQRAEQKMGQTHGSDILNNDIMKSDIMKSDIRPHITAFSPRNPNQAHSSAQGTLFSNLNPAQDTHMADMPSRRFTFDNFVIGPSNELAYAVAKQVASETIPSYNPIVIHGQNGMGKTHLLYAVKHMIEDQYPQKSVHLISSEQFVNNFVRSVRKSGRDDIEHFKASLRDVDVLIIDDAHFIADKPGSQEELLHTLVSLVDAGRQILLASDSHPDKIETASERLKSYLSSGLVCKIGSADYELRLRILDRLIARRRDSGNSTLAIPKNARDLLAAKINATPRDLEGAFNQVVAQSEFLGTPITLESIQDTLSDSRYAAGQRLTVDKIQRIVSDAFEITLDDMTSKRRARNIARPRQVAMYFCKMLTKRSLPDIGKRFGGRDHTTVMHAVKRIESLRREDVALNAQISKIEKILKPL